MYIRRFLTPVRPITRGGGGGGGGCHMEAAVRMDEGLLAQTNGCRSAAAEDAASSAAAATVAAGGGGGEENRTTPRVSSSNNNGDRLGNSNNSSASGGTGIFSKELISFSLYGKIPRKSSKLIIISQLAIERVMFKERRAQNELLT